MTEPPEWEVPVAVITKKAFPVVEDQVQRRDGKWFELNPTTILGLPTETDRAWAAGFFDGEGSVNFRKGKKSPSGRQYYSIHVSVGQSVIEPLAELQEYYGGSIYTFHPGPGRKYTKDFYQWSIVGTRAIVFLTHILPHLRVKGGVVEASMKSWMERWVVMPK